MRGRRVRRKIKRVDRREKELETILRLVDRAAGAMQKFRSGGGKSARHAKTAVSLLESASNEIDRTIRAL